MGTLFSTLDIARSGLQVAQVQMDVAGHNVANVNKEGYSRQRVDLVSPTPVTQSYGAIGRGVQVKLIERLRETFLDTVYRNEAGNLGASNIRAPYFDRIQDLFNEPGDQGFGSNITAFFDSLNDFANNVEEVAVRMSVVNQAETLAASFNQLARQIYALRTNANEEVVNTVPDINSLARQIAALNVTIRNSEAAGVKANDLRDERDLLLDRLAGTVNIQFRERDNGQIDVLIGGESFIDGDKFRALEAVRDPGIDSLRQDLVTVRFADNGQAVNVQGGLLYGALLVRDTDLAVLTNRVDTLAATIIREINKIHAAGNGLDNLSGVVSAANAVTDASAALNAAGLPFAVEPGSFDVVVYDS
ncbi:MAG TPA: flagellar hook-associated protein FlgK, partial [Candidatus Hydrogenedentes bacterium]|nr:flagellar hook-associated protein FlgK [Candidatus Hydrogenedentota bacterium]